MNVLSSLLVGLLFGLGLIVSDMADPARVLAFLNVTSGAWDPTLLFVMAGAMGVMTVAWQIRRRMTRAVLGGPLPATAPATVDRRLVSGAVMFGTGWGMVGVCPGPALVGLGMGNESYFIFTAAMMVGVAGNLIFTRPGFVARPARAS